MSTNERLPYEYYEEQARKQHALDLEFRNWEIAIMLLSQTRFPMYFEYLRFPQHIPLEPIRPLLRQFVLEHYQNDLTDILIDHRNELRLHFKEDARRQLTDALGDAHANQLFEWIDVYSFCCRMKIDWELEKILKILAETALSQFPASGLGDLQLSRIIALTKDWFAKREAFSELDKQAYETIGVRDAWEEICIWIYHSGIGFGSEWVREIKSYTVVSQYDFMHGFFWVLSELQCLYAIRQSLNAEEFEVFKRWCEAFFPTFSQGRSIDADALFQIVADVPIHVLTYGID